jgi:hypothetical protein
MELTGLFPNEFDRTTSAVLHTVQALGVPDKAIEEDQNFLVDLMLTVGGVADDSDTADTVAAMDCAFIGLLYHRHMPFMMSHEDGAVKAPEREATDYAFTLNGRIEHAGTPVQPARRPRVAHACRRALRHRHVGAPPHADHRPSPDGAMKGTTRHASNE